MDSIISSGTPNFFSNDRFFEAFLAGLNNVEIINASSSSPTYTISISASNYRYIYFYGSTGISGMSAGGYYFSVILPLVKTFEFNYPLAGTTALYITYNTNGTFSASFSGSSGTYPTAAFFIPLNL